MAVLICFSGVLIYNTLLPQVNPDFELCRHFLVDFDYGIKKCAIRKVRVHQLGLDSSLQLVLLRFKTVNLFRVQAYAHIVDDHALTLDGDIAFAILLKSKLIIPILVKFYVKICEFGLQLFNTIME